MTKNSFSLRSALAILFGLALCANARAQLTFNTLAGYAGKDTVDASRPAARFVNPSAMAIDTNGNTYIADAGNHTIRKITPAGLVSTLAGLAGVSGSADGTNSVARFNQPSGIAVDGTGTIYVSDSGNHTIRKITSAGVVTTLAGQAGVSGTLDQLGTNAQFSFPQGIVINSTAHLLVADYGNHSIRKITPGGSVSTYAGVSGSFGTNDGVGASARFYQPQGLAIDPSDNLYVGDTANHTIRRVTPSATVSTFAGSPGNPGTNDGVGSAARFYQPEAVALDSAGNIFVADYFNNTIRMVTPGASVSTLAGSPGVFGSADGTNSAALFGGPEGIAVDATGNVYVADTANGTVRQISLAGPVATVSTWAGSPSGSAANANGNLARFFLPGSIAASGTGVVYVADTANSAIRKVTALGLVSTVAGLAGSPGSADGNTNVSRVNAAQGVATDAAGNVYVADTANATIRKIALDGTMTTLAGAAGTNGSLDGIGNSALFNNPQALCVDLSGNIYVADTWNHVIRQVTQAGAVTTIAGYTENYGNADGSNTLARFYYPSGIALDGAGNLYVSDTFNHAIRKVTPSGANWLVSTIAGLAGVWGNTDSSNQVARFNQPQGISIDAGGNLYVVDSGNSVIRKIAPSGTNWIVTTVAGLTNNPGFTNGTGTSARFSSPVGIAVLSGGSVFVVDSGNNTIRLSALVSSTAPAIINQPLSQTVNPGSNVTFTVAVAGSTPFSYQWRFNGTNIAGMTASAYTRTNAQPTNAGNYSVLITNTIGRVVSADAALVVNTPPSITQQPQGQAIALGQDAVFTVVAAGTAPLSYQWRFQGVPIPGETSSSLTVSSVVVSNTGSYSVTVSNIVGSALSADAFLSVVSLLGQGDNTFGQSLPSLNATNAVAISAGGWHSLALRADGHIVAWGDNFNGQCNVPAGLSNVLAIAAGGFHSAAIRSDLRVTAWGANDYGQTNVPAGLSNVLAVACGTWHTLALRADGTVVGWGDNSDGQVSIPAGLSGVVAIAAGGGHSLALKSDGTVVAWGDNTAQNGGYGGASVVPAGLANVTRIAAGDFHSLALKSDGSIVAWGDNAQGQCTIPPGLANVVTICGGGAHSLALKADGTVAAWGADAEGQCDLPGNTTDAVGISAGEAHSLVLVRSAAPAAQLWGPVWHGGKFNATAQTLNRKNYALDYSLSLSPQIWIPISTNAGNGALEILTDPSATGPSRFYRMRQF